MGYRKVVLVFVSEKPQYILSVVNNNCGWDWKRELPKKPVRGDLRLHSENGKFCWKPKLETQFVAGMEFRLIDALTIRGSIPVAPLKA